MFMLFQVALHERVVVLRDGLPREALSPGQYTRWGFSLSQLRFNTKDLVIQAASEVCAVLPSDWYTEVVIAHDQRALVYRKGKPMLFLTPGTHWVWAVDPDVEVLVVSVNEPMPNLNQDLENIVPDKEYLVFAIPVDQVGVMFRAQQPAIALGPGRHGYWGENLHLQTWTVDALTFNATPRVLQTLPPEWFAEVAIAKDERGVLYNAGVPRAYLAPGLHRYWTLDPSTHLEVMVVDRGMPELTNELKAVLPTHCYVDVVVAEYQNGIKYINGRLVEVLGPGHYSFWSHPAASVQVQVVDMRRSEIQLSGQELMTRDKVTLRLSLTIEYAIDDPVKALHQVANLRDALYLLVQLAARDYVAGVRLDELLEGRDEMTKFLRGQVEPKAQAFGVTVAQVGVKDVVLPGEMKTLLNRVIEAEKEAAANVILRREETAATRSLANTARVMADNPVLLRLKELDAMKEIAGQIGEVRIVVGADGLNQLLPAGLLGGSKAV